MEEFVITSHYYSNRRDILFIVHLGFDKSFEELGSLIAYFDILAIFTKIHAVSG
jgi:hypothetical protein